MLCRLCGRRWLFRPLRDRTNNQVARTAIKAAPMADPTATPAATPVETPSLSSVLHDGVGEPDRNVGDSVEAVGVSVVAVEGIGTDLIVTDSLIVVEGKGVELALLEAPGLPLMAVVVVA